MSDIIKSENIELDLKEFVEEEILDSNLTVELSTTLEEIGVQSLDILEIIFFIERRYSCKLPREILRGENLKTLKSIAEFSSKFLEENQ